jgi:hypothetical protein
MAEIVYSRTFQHVDWIDNEDVVQAGGEKGFNQKFHALEAELDKLSAVVGAIKDALGNIQELADGVVTTSKIADGAVNNAKLQANAVARPNIQNGAVSLGKIAFQQVNSGSAAVPANGIAHQLVQQNILNTRVIYFPTAFIINSTGPNQIRHIEVTMAYEQNQKSETDVHIVFRNRGNLDAQVNWVVNTFAT